MTIMDRKIWQRIFAICFVIMMVRYYPMLSMIDVRAFLQHQTLNYIHVFVGLFYFFNIVSVVALIKGIRWASIMSAVAIVYSTVFFNVSYWPFIVDAFFSASAHEQMIAQVCANVVMVGILIGVYCIKPAAPDAGGRPAF